MLLLCIAWLLITASTLGMGAAVLALAGQGPTLGKKTLAAPVVAVLGLAAVSVLIAIWSLWMPLGHAWGAVLFSVTLLPLVVPRVRAIVLHAFTPGDGWAVAAPAIAGLFATALLKAAGATEIFDDAVAYLPIFRTMLDEGVVIGLGNLHPNFAYNSHWSLLGAFYSFEWLFGRALYDINGWVAWLGAWYAFSFLPELWKGRVRGLYLLAAATPFFFFRNQMSGNSTDLPVSIISWIILVEWLLRTDEGRPGIGRLLFIALPLFAFTVKITALSLLLLPLALLWEEAPRRRLGTLGFAVMVAIVMLAPWFARNVLMTGYLYFLAPGLDLFTVDWKVPLTVLARLKIQVATDIHHGPKRLADPEWWRAWWQEGMNAQSRVMIALAAMGAVIGGVAAAFSMGQLGRAARHSRILTFCAVQAVGLLFWFSAATEPRYGHAALTFGSLGLLCWAAARLPTSWMPGLGKSFVVLMTLAMGVAAYRSIKEFTPYMREVAVWPAPYPEVEWRDLRGSNFTAHFPYRLVTRLDDRLRFPATHTAGRERYPNCWCTPMPCLYRPQDLPLLQARGASLRDGFRYVRAPKE